MPHQTEIAAPAAALAAAIAGAKQAGQAIAAPSPWRPADAAAAYAVQRLAFAAAGPIATWKVAQSAQWGPMLGPVPATRLHRGAGTVTVPPGLRSVAEFEVAFAVPESLAAEVQADEIAASLRPLALVEIVTFDLIGPDAADELMKIASGLVNRAVVVGEPVAADGAGEAITPSALVDGTLRFGGGHCAQVAACRAIAARTFAWLAAHVGPVAAGTIVTTGAIGPVLELERDCTIAASFGPLGTVSVAVTA